MRDAIHYGHKVSLFCQSRNGHVLATTSALMPLGVLPDDPTRDPPPFERAVFVIAPAEGDHRRHRQHNEELKFGQVIRLVHDSSDMIVTCSDSRHGLVDKANQRVVLERPGVLASASTTVATKEGGGGGGGKGGAGSSGGIGGSGGMSGGGSGGGGGSSNNANGGPIDNNSVQQFDRWRVLPRYRVRAEGERVRDQDHVVLQAATGENFFLYVSKSRDSDGYHELNCGPTSEGFGMMLYDKDPPPIGGALDGEDSHGGGIRHGGSGAGAADDAGGSSGGGGIGTSEEKELRGGSCIMLFHKEEKGFVFADTINKTCVLDPYDDPNLGRIAKTQFSAPLNSKMMYIIEFEDRRRGGVVTSGRKQLFRLKALSNNMYLCVRSKGDKVSEKGGAKDGASEMGGSVYSSGSQAPSVTINEHAISLTADANNPGTLFAFHQAADDQGGTLRNRSRIYCEAPEIGEVGVWLSVGSRVTTRMVTESASALLNSGAGAKKSARPKKKLVFQDVQNMKDGIEIQRVPRYAYSALINVLTLMPPLEAFAQQAGEVDDIPNYHLLTQSIENLATLRRYCFVSEEKILGSIASSSSSSEGTSGEFSSDEILKGTVDREGQRRLLDQGIVSIALLIAKNLTLNKNVDLGLLGSTETVGGDADGASSKVSAKNDALITVKYADIQKVLALCFGIVQDIVRSSPYNAASISTDNIDFIVNSCPKIPAALDCLVECFKNNPLLVDTGDDLKTLKFLVDWFMTSGRDERILDILTLLVECEDTRLTNAQNYVCETLLRKRDIAALLFAPFTSQGGAQVGVASWYLGANANQQQRGAGLGSNSTNPAASPPNGLLNGSVNGSSMNASAQLRGIASPSASFYSSNNGGASSQHHVLHFSPTQADVAGSQMMLLTKLNEVMLGMNSSAGQQRMEGFIRYVAKQLLFFAGLCAGQNSSAIAIVHQLVPVEIILPMMMSEALHVSLRAAFVKLFNNSVVDVEGAVDLTEHVRSIRHVIDDPINSDAYNVEHDVSEMLGNSKRFVLNFLRRSRGRLDVHQPDALQVTDSVLRLLTALLQRGMFALTEYTELIWLLCAVLDSRNDVTEKYLSDVAVSGAGQQASALIDMRVRVTEEARPLITIKLRVFRCLFIIVELLLTQHVSTVVNGFVRGRSIGHVTQLVDVDPFSKISAFSFGVFNRRKTLSESVHSIANERDRSIAIDKAERDLVNSPLGGLLEDGPLLPILSHLIGVVMTVAQYQDIRMRTAAVELFCVITNFPGEVLKKCRRVQLLTSHASAGYYNNIKSIALELERSAGVAILNSDGGGGTSGKFGIAGGGPGGFGNGPQAHAGGGGGRKGSSISAPTLTMDRMQIAAACLERLEFLSAQKEGGAMIEKIAMMRHVGIPKILTVLLSAIPTPPREEYRRFVFNCVALLKTLAEDELICEMLCEQASEFTHLTSYDMDILALLRVLYVNRNTSEQPISADTVKQIVSCITFPHSAVPAVLLLQDLLKKTDSKGKYLTRNQVLVWRALINDTGVLKIIKLRRQWTGRRGRPMRDSLLSSREYFNPSGNLRLHLELVKLLFLISKFNDTVRAEEVRFEIFGVNAIEDLMEVVTNAKLPAFYRNTYLMLLQVLIIDDKEDGFQSLINHRKLPELIEMCQSDVETLSILCQAYESAVSSKFTNFGGGGGGGGNRNGGLSTSGSRSGAESPYQQQQPASVFHNPFGGGGESPTNSNNGGNNNAAGFSPSHGRRLSQQQKDFDGSFAILDASMNVNAMPFSTDARVKVCVPENDLERAVEERRNGLAFFTDHVTLAVLPALKHLVTRVLLKGSSSSSSANRVSVFMKGAIVTTINEVVDSVCELTRLVFVTSLRPFSEYPGFGDNIDCRRRLRAFLLEAVRLECKGTDDWSDDVNLLALIIPTNRVDNGGGGAVAGGLPNLQLVGNANGGDEDFAGAKDEKALTSRWLDYLHQQLEVKCDAVKDKNYFATAAGIILRAGPCGSKFAATLVKSIDEISEEYQLSCFHIIRQIAALTQLHLHDDSLMLTFDPSTLLASGGGMMSSSSSGSGGGSALSSSDISFIRRELTATVGTGSSTVTVRLLGIGALTAMALDAGPIVGTAASNRIAAAASPTSGGVNGGGAAANEGGGGNNNKAENPLKGLSEGPSSPTMMNSPTDPANKNASNKNNNDPKNGGGGSGGNAVAIVPSNSSTTSITASQANMLFRIAFSVGNATEGVQLNHSLKTRQDIMSRWGRGYNDQVLPTIISLFSTDDVDILMAGTECANMLLDGGNKKMQNAFKNWVADRSDEEIFLVLRNRLSSCRDSLRYYAHLRRRDVDPGNTLELLPTYHNLLRFIQLLCEGHNDDLQRYLRAQPDNQISVNVLECVEGVLEVAASCVDGNTVGFVQQLLATISETIQGPCKTNQDMFVSSGIADHLVKILNLPRDIPNCNAQDVQRARLLAMTTLLSLLEGRSEVSYVAMAISSLDLRLLGKAMDRSLMEYEEAHGELTDDDADHSMLRQWCTRFWSSSAGASSSSSDSSKGGEQQKRKSVTSGGGSGASRSGDNTSKSITEHGDAKKAEHLHYKDEMSDELNVGCSVFILFKSCLDLEHLHNIEFTDRFGSTLKQVLRHTSSFREINQRVAMIELIRGNVLERAYFRIPMLCKENLKELSKTQLIAEVSRDSDNDRLLDYFERCMKLIAQVEYYGYLREIPIFHFIHDNITVVESCAILFAFAINILMLATFSLPKDSYTKELADGPAIALDVLGAICIFLQSVLFIHFCVGGARVMLDDFWSQQLDDLNQQAVQDARENLSVEPPIMIRDIKAVFKWYHRLFMSAQHLLESPLCWRRALFCACAFAGIFHSPVWYSVLILQITVKNRLLLNCVYAVTKNGASLILTAFLMVCVAYVFASIAYLYFPSYFNPYGDQGVGVHCHSLLHCTLVNSVYGIMYGGAHEISDPANPQPHYTKGYGKLAFDFFYFVILTVLFMNIVTGIIIDTFAELREERDFIEDDQQRKCFICGIEQNNFDKIAPGSFDHHVNFEHNMWHYLYFFHYIKLKDSEDHNGQEQYVRNKLLHKDLSFFPIGRAMMLENSEAFGGGGADSGGGGLSSGAAQEERLLAIVTAVIKKEMSAIEEKIEKVAERLGMSGDEFEGLMMGGNTISNTLETASRRSGGGGSASNGRSGPGGGSNSPAVSASGGYGGGGAASNAGTNTMDGRVSPAASALPPASASGAASSSFANGSDNPLGGGGTMGAFLAGRSESFSAGAGGGGGLASLGGGGVGLGGALKDLASPGTTKPRGAGVSFALPEKD